MSDATSIFDAIDHNNPRLAGRLLALVSDELRKLAASKMAREPAGQALDATALVHEAYLRLIGRDPAKVWDGRAHFFAAAAEAMRRILVEKAPRPASAQTRRTLWTNCRLTRMKFPLLNTRTWTSCSRSIKPLTDSPGGRGAADLVKLRITLRVFPISEAAEILGISRTALGQPSLELCTCWLRRALNTE